MLLTVRQLHEMSRIASRHGAAGLAALPHGAVAVRLAMPDSRRTALVLALAPDGRVLASRRLDRSDA